MTIASLQRSDYFAALYSAYHPATAAPTRGRHALAAGWVTTSAVAAPALLLVAPTP